ncbi:hypothetical protein VNO77_03673 [Canavalia gladiata]|uniref:Uncharacterized protein n=1 Tax=Canavalia gladiata TaxID=3824 RepID=A0AAN9N090_CANGL
MPLAAWVSLWPCLKVDVKRLALYYDRLPPIHNIVSGLARGMVLNDARVAHGTFLIHYCAVLSRSGGALLLTFSVPTSIFGLMLLLFDHPEVSYNSERDHANFCASYNALTSSQSSLLASIRRGRVDEVNRDQLHSWASYLILITKGEGLEVQRGHSGDKAPSPTCRDRAAPGSMEPP